MQTVTCPACGASATNLQNCEYCGSLFVRYSDKGVRQDADSLFGEERRFEGFIFTGLEEELRKNISLQAKETFIVTDIHAPSSSQPTSLQIVQSNFDKRNLDPSFPGIAIHIPFAPGNGNDFEKFMELEESALFTKIDDDEKFYSYFVDFGNDSIGAAHLSSIILVNVMGVPESDLLEYSTSDYNETLPPNNSENGSWCFIATATMGSYDHPEVMELRRFRDNWLLKKTWGRTFTKYYYRYGSYLAKFIENSKLLKKLSYVFIIKPLLFIVRIIY